MMIPDGWIVAVGGTLGAGVSGAFTWMAHRLTQAERKIERLEAEINVWQTRFVDEIRRGVRSYNEPPPRHPTMPPPPDSEPTGVRDLRKTVATAELDAVLDGYLASQRKGSFGRAH